MVASGSQVVSAVVPSLWSLVGLPDGGDGTPQLVGVFRVVQGDGGVGQGGVELGEQMRGAVQVGVLRGGDLIGDGVPVVLDRGGPERRVLGVRGGAVGTGLGAQVLGFGQRGGVGGAVQRRWRRRPELVAAVQHERHHRSPNR